MIAARGAHQFHLGLVTQSVESERFNSNSMTDGGGNRNLEARQFASPGIERLSEEKNQERLPLSQPNGNREVSPLEESRE